MSGREYFEQVTIDGITIYAGTASPNGVLSATRGSLFSNKTDGSIWKNTNGTTAWTELGSSSGSGQRETFTYRPSGVEDPTSGVYVTWAATHAAARAVADLGNLVTIIVDSTLGAPVILAGTFNMQDIKCIGITGLGAAIGGSPYTPLGTSQGTIFTNWTLGMDFIHLTHNSTLPLYAPLGVAGFQITRTGYASQYSATLAGPVWHAAGTSGGDGAPGPMLLFMDEYAVFPTSVLVLRPEVVQSTAPGSVSIRFAIGAVIEADTLRGDGDFSLTNMPTQDSFELDQSNVSGNLTTAFLDPAYTDATPGDWAGAPPLSHNSAISRIATAVTGLLAGPIP